MASGTSVMVKALDIKGMHVDRVEYVADEAVMYGEPYRHDHIDIHARPYQRIRQTCPVCGEKCPLYDHKAAADVAWRANSLNGVPVYIFYQPARIECPQHGVLTEYIPWADGRSHFTRGFNDETAFLALTSPKTVVSQFMGINWRTVGNCIKAAHGRIEPNVSDRLHGLKRICVDETSYHKGHKYITVIVNHDTNTVVWAAQGHGKGVLTQFYKQLTPEQLSSIKVVTGDGAKWITECVNEFTPDCERCVDPFHVVQWAMEALDEVRREVWREAYAEFTRLSKEHPRKKGRPKDGDPESAILNAAKAKADEIKNSAYALGKAPENLTENQQNRVAMIAENNNRLYRAYRMKEMLRLLLKIKDTDEAEDALRRWLWWASHSRIDAFKELYLKIKRHKEHILNAIRLGMSNARIEATNNKIKLIVRKAYGSRNIQNMLDMVYLVCSDLRVPLPNRKPRGA